VPPCSPSCRVRTRVCQVLEQFSQRSSFAATSSFLRQHADLLLSDTTLLPRLAKMASVAMYAGDEARARQCLQQLLLLQTCQSVGRGPGIDIFFHGCDPRPERPHGPWAGTTHTERLGLASLQRNDLQQRDHFHADVNARLRELQGHVSSFHARQAARVASAAATATTTAATTATATAATKEEDELEQVSTARGRALAALPSELQTSLRQGQVDKVNAYLAAAPLEEVRARAHGRPAVVRADAP
jgi:hypothetical protein